MTDNTLIQEVYRQAYADVLFDHAKHVLCPACSNVMESAALDRYKMMMAKRREETSELEAKIEKQKQTDARRKELGGAHEK